MTNIPNWFSRLAPVPSILRAACLAALVFTVGQVQGQSALDDGSRIGRSASAKAPEFQELYDYDGAALSLADATFPYEVQLHRAHALMLSEQRILSDVETRQILRGLSRVDVQAQQDATLRAYLPYEHALIKAIGPVAGKLHIGRSRNDLANAVNRMFYRDQVNRTLEALIALRRTLNDQAAAQIDTVMVVYTHRKQAQPITLGHYLMAISESLGKSIDRYEQLYGRMNLNPLGAAASAGSGWPLDRQRTAHLLGFDGLVVNTIEATAGWDHIAEFAADNAIYMSMLSRLASEIQLWSSDEYRSAELDGAFAGTSSIMPQKKNPDSLERTRQIAAATMGPLVSILASLNGIEYQHSVARVALEPRSIDAMLAATHAMTGVVRTLQPQRAQMLHYAAEGFSTMTELTDTIVRESGISFRDAHEVMAAVVEGALAEGKKANAIDLAMIEQAAQKKLGRTLNVSAEAVRQALDPVQNVARRDGIGGPAPSSVRTMIDAASAQTAQQAARQALRLRRVRDAQAQLTAAVAEKLR